MFAYHREHPEIYARSKLPRTCVGCGRTYKPGNNEAGKFCTAECYNKYRTAHEGAIKIKRTRAYPCEFCGTPVLKTDAQAKRVARHYCSGTCSARARSEAWREMKGEITEKGVPLECGHCKQIFYARPYAAKIRRYCSKVCSNAAQYGKPGHKRRPGTYEGEDNPNYRGTSNLVTARRIALTYSPACCMICGFDILVTIHHIDPRRHGGQNKPENLAVLCPNHHAMADRNLVPAEELFAVARKALAASPKYQARLRRLAQSKVQLSLQFDKHG